LRIADFGLWILQKLAGGSWQQAEGKHHELERKSLEVGGQENRSNILSPGFWILTTGF
jgi:hypothetical protein